VIRNNMTATFLMSKEVYLRSMEQHGGAIINVGADFELGMPGMGHNGAARAGQTNFTYTASVEWAHSGVRVNSVIPGFIASSGLDRYPERAHDVLRNVKGKVPLKRHGTESEIAGAIVYLLSPAAAYVTGIGLRVDGGLHNNAKSNFYEVPDHERSQAFNGFPLYRVPKVLE
jgi:citronellol/citronellal dehydrogenase